MFCPTCGVQAAADATRCANCETLFTSAALKAGAARLAQSGVVRGFLVLWGAWFTMPFKTLRITAQQLREIGGGGLDVHNDVPHLTWMRVAGGTLASIAIVVVLAGGVVKGVAGLGDMRWSPWASLGGLVGYPLAALLIAIALDWFVMMGTELLGLWLGVSSNIRRIALRGEAP